jgi:polyphosphate kinase
MIALIDREAANAARGLPARIIAKMNALSDPLIIAALCRASQAGVPVDLIVRGVCCLRPRVKGVSERITVRSIVDRFMEHSRVFYFENACQPEIFAGSADWMPRNFFRRIEVVFPIEDGNLRERIRGELLETILRDNVKVRFLQRGGSWKRPRRAAGEPARRSQSEFIQMAESPPRAGAAAGESEFARFKLVPSPFAAGGAGVHERLKAEG